MTPQVVVIVQPNIDFNTLIALNSQILGYSLSHKVDQSRLDHSDIDRFLSCLGAFRNEDAPITPTPESLHFASTTLQITADERDMLSIIESALGMPVFVRETIVRGVLSAIIHGTLAQWRAAVKSGARQDADRNVRACYCQIMGLFEQLGLKDLWNDYQTKSMNDRTFYLEDRR